MLFDLDDLILNIFVFFGNAWNSFVSGTCWVFTFLLG